MLGRGHISYRYMIVVRYNSINMNLVHVGHHVGISPLWGRILHFFVRESRLWPLNSKSLQVWMQGEGEPWGLSGLGTFVKRAINEQHSLTPALLYVPLVTLGVCVVCVPGTLLVTGCLVRFFFFFGCPNIIQLLDYWLVFGCK